MTTLDAYTAAYDSSAIFDFPAYGVIQITGTEAVRFLNGLTTNDIAALQPDSWLLAAFPNAQGRIIALTRVLCIAPETFVFITEPETYNVLLANLTRFTYAGDFHLADLTATHKLISLQGATSAKLISRVFNLDVERLNANELQAASFDNEAAYIFKSRHAPAGGFDVLTTNHHALTETLTQSGAIPVDETTRETLRIEAGVPRFGVDYTEQTIVLETGLDEALSYTKGCYIGQEIIARIHYRGHVAKGLVQLTFDDAQPVASNTKLYSTDGKETGRITSSTVSPRHNKAIAIALIKYAYLARDTELHTEPDGGRTARVTSDFNLNI